MAEDYIQTNVKYKVFSPGGNATAVVFVYQSALFSDISKDIMAKNKEIEQVGFILPKDESFRLQMMGGEFCVNAARSAACLWLKEKNNSEVEFEVSGFNGKVIAKKYGQTVSLCTPESLVVNCMSVFDGFLVEMQGISYIVRTKKDVDAASLVRSYYNGSPAFGIINVERRDNFTLEIESTVWVRETGTFINETACGSGSIAACVPFVSNFKTEKFFVRQPSGHIYEISFIRNILGKNVIVVGGEVVYCGEGELVKSSQKITV